MGEGEGEGEGGKGRGKGGEGKGGEREWKQGFLSFVEFFSEHERMEERDRLELLAGGSQGYSHFTHHTS